MLYRGWRQQCNFLMVGGFGLFTFKHNSTTDAASFLPGDDTTRHRDSPISVLRFSEISGPLASVDVSVNVTGLTREVTAKGRNVEAVGDNFCCEAPSLGVAANGSLLEGEMARAYDLTGKLMGLGSAFILFALPTCLDDLADRLSGVKRVILVSGVACADPWPSSPEEPGEEGSTAAFGVCDMTGFVGRGAPRASR
jgi:hypothetical protein